VESADQPDWVTLLRELVRLLPEDVVERLREAVAPPPPGRVLPHTLAYAGLAEGVGTALPATIDASATVYPPTVIHGPPPSLRTRQDRYIAAMIVAYVTLTYISLATRPFPESLVEPLAVAIGLLALGYPRE
jgi:hypothetical protein